MSAQGYLQEQGFQDPYNFGQGMASDYTDPGSVYGNGSITGALARFFDPKGYSLWQSNMDKAYERETTNSARAWDLWMDSTATQRRVEDIKKAGLNPWLALQSGGINANTSTASAGSGSSARSKESKSNIGSIAMVLLAAAKLFSML